MRTAILASRNENKIKELKAILEKYGLDVISRDDAGIPQDEIEETGTTFEENSLLKAYAIMDILRAEPEFACYNDSPVIADDSGLMVDALNGEPGVYSARYAGEDCSYADNNRKLTAALEGVPTGERNAHFVTVITVLYPKGSEAPPAAEDRGDYYILTARGELYGHIATEPRGEQGFGYDPLFIPEGHEETFAELGTAYKNTISHRANALRELERQLSR